MATLLKRRRARRQRLAEQEGKVKRRRYDVRPLNMNRTRDGEFGTLVQEMRSVDEEMHQLYFRMSAWKFDELAQRIAPFIRHSKTHRAPVGVAERLAVTLRFLANGCSQKSVAESYRLGVSTVSVVVAEVCRALWGALQPEFVAFPSPVEWADIAQDFWEMWNFPLCLGAVGVKRVQIKAPPKSGGEGDNKRTSSIALVAACDAHYRFTIVDAGDYGRDDDSVIFRDSVFGSRLTDGKLTILPPNNLPGSDVINPHAFVGDAAFPLHENLMRPYPGVNLPVEQQTYNDHHCRVTRIIENAFGVLESRWRVFGRPTECSIANTVHIVKACVALHNFLTCTDTENTANARYIPANYTDSTTPCGDVQPGEWRQHVDRDDGLLNTGQLSTDRTTSAALNARHNLASFFRTPAGHYP